MLSFQNDGLIDIRAATTMGINAKADSSAIGFFGTGLKYSIACILRWGGKITIYRGLEAFEFTALDCSVRDKGFAVVCMNGRELGFVTDYGKKWEAWQVYRELYTNCQDERGEITRVDAANPAEGMTTVVVDCDELDLAHEARNQFILEGEAAFTTDHGAIYDLPAKSIFYQKLCVSRPPKGMLFTYNIRQPVDLTEDRTLSNAWVFDVVVSRLVDALCNSPSHRHHEMAKAILLASDDHWEHQVHYGLGSSGERSENFYLMAEHLMRHHATRLNRSVCELLLKRKPLVESVEVFEPSDFQQTVLNRAADFAEVMGFKVRDYPVVCAERLGDGVLGLAHQGTIYVTRQAFELGTKMVASTLIEEFIHLREGVKDYSRAMQEVLFNRLITLGEEHVWGGPL